MTLKKQGGLRTEAPGYLGSSVSSFPQDLEAAAQMVRRKMTLVPAASPQRHGTHCYHGDGQAVCPVALCCDHLLLCSHPNSKSYLWGCTKGPQ